MEHFKEYESRILVERNTEFFLNKFRKTFNQCLASVAIAKFSRHKG